MKTFNFLAKQGQHNQIARILTREIGKPKLSRYSGPRGEGVMITLQVPSKRAADRLLHDEGVAGSVARSSLPVISEKYKWDLMMKALDRLGFREPFIGVIDGSFIGRVQVEYVDFGCTCCGGYTDLVNL